MFIGSIIKHFTFPARYIIDMHYSLKTFIRLKLRYYVRG